LNTSLDTRLSLPLGHTEDQNPISLDLAASPHTLVVGSCGTGKSVLLRALAMTALRRGFQVVIIDTIKQALDFRPLEGRATIARDGEAAVTALEDLVAEMSRRTGLLRTHEASSVSELPASEDLRPILLVIDEYASTVLASPLPKYAGRDSDMYTEAFEHNALAERILYLASKIARQARSVGIHLAISTQRPDVQSIPRGMRDNLGNVIMTVRPAKPVSPDMLNMVFYDKADVGTVSAAVATAVGSTGHGHAVLVTERGTVTPLQFSRPAED